MKRKIRRIKRKLTKSKIPLTIATLIIIAAIIITITLMQRIINSNQDFKNLINESKEIKKNLEVDNIDPNYIKKLNITKITKTKNNNQIENALEEYTLEYSNIINESIKSIKDQKYTNILTANNYQEDGPAFTNSITYINNKKKDLATNKENLNKITNEKEYLKYIQAKTQDEKEINKYKKLITNIINNEEIELLIKDLDRIDKILDISNDIFVYLGRNSTAYYIENNNIVFTNQEIKTEYEKAINRIKNT